MKASPNRARTRLIRAGLAALYLAAAALVFYHGKGHTVLIDNKPTPDGSYEAVEGVMVSVDGLEALELYPGDRDLVEVRAQEHSVTVELIGDGRRIEKRFNLALGEEMVLLSVPKLAAGMDDFIEAWSSADQYQDAREEAAKNPDEFTRGGPDEPGAAEPGEP
jgi:hypothetical protein